jgi:3-methyladenine DNA glycosylase AlkD
MERRPMPNILPVESRVRDAVAWLRKRATRKNRDGMARYGIVSPKIFGVSVATIRELGKRLGQDHELALALWPTGWHEARMLAAFVEDPDRVTSRQMDGWARDFDNWALCDTVCLHLFDKTPHAWRQVKRWSGRRDEFVRRAAFATLAGLALHDTRAADEQFLRALPLIEAAATDDRILVRKGVSWALRTVGRRSDRLNVAATDVARRLIDMESRSARWIGRDAFRELTSRAVQRRVARKDAALASGD